MELTEDLLGEGRAQGRCRGGVQGMASLAAAQVGFGAVSCPFQSARSAGMALDALQTFKFKKANLKGLLCKTCC